MSDEFEFVKELKEPDDKSLSLEDMHALICYCQDAMSHYGLDQMAGKKAQEIMDKLIEQLR